MIKIVTEETPHKLLFTWNFDIIFTYVGVTSVNIVCPEGMILSQQGVIFRALISNISVSLTKYILKNKCKCSGTI